MGNVGDNVGDVAYFCIVGVAVAVIILFVIFIIGMGVYG
jgi:hypothetical protein